MKLKRNKRIGNGKKRDRDEKVSPSVSEMLVVTD